MNKKVALESGSFCFFLASGSSETKKVCSVQKIPCNDEFPKEAVFGQKNFDVPQQGTKLCQ